MDSGARTQPDVCSAVEEEGFLDKVKHVIDTLTSDNTDPVGREERHSSGDNSQIKEETMVGKEREALEKIQREKAQSEFLNTMQQQVIQSAGGLAPEEALAMKRNLENIDIRTLTLKGGSEEQTSEEDSGEVGIFEKVKNAAMSAIDAITADAEEKADDYRRLSSEGLVDEENMTPAEKAHFEKIKMEKEQSELLNKVQKKKIKQGEETFCPLKAQDDLRKQESKKIERKPSKSAPRSKSSAEKKSSVAGRRESMSKTKPKTNAPPPMKQTTVG